MRFSLVKIFYSIRSDNKLGNLYFNLLMMLKASDFIGKGVVQY